jgi:alkylated DNA repair dioxygenase AlkB
MEQPAFHFAAPVLPPGMDYCADFISASEERNLIERIGALPFRPAQYKEWNARRRIISYGGRYDFAHNTLLDADPIAVFLHPLRERVAAWIGIEVPRLTHALINEYSPGTPLGWHRDAPVYETVAGVSLASAGRMRLRPYPPPNGPGKAAHAVELAARSVYVLSGAARWDWQHAISPTKALRYSITFRTLSSRG